MADNTTINSGTGDAIRDVDRAGVKTQVMLLDLGGLGGESLLSSTNPLPVTVTNFPASQAVTGPLTDTELRASAVPVSGPLTDTQLRADAVPVSLTTASSVSVANFPATYPVTDNGGSLTVDAPFGTPVAVRLSDGTTWLSTLGVSMAQLPAALGANGGLKIEGISSGAAVSVSGTFFQTTQPVSGTFWQTTQPVSIATPVTLSTASTLPVSGTFWQTTQPVSIGTTVAVSAPVAAPVFVRLSDGSAAIATLPVSITTASSMSVICSTANTLSVAVSTAGVVAVGGNISTGTAEAGNAIKVGGAVVVAKGALPTAASNGVRVAQTFDAYGRAVARKGDTWVKTHDPGPAAQASCNSTAQAAGVRNVCTSLALSLTSSAAATATNPITFVLYDGTTAGTALWQIRATMPVGAGNAFFMALGDLWIEGTAATAMTLATNAATTTTVSASVSMTGTISQ